MNSTNRKRKLVTWLFNPFVYIAGWQALLIGLIAILVTGFIGSFSNTHFDGVLDAHSGMPAPLWFFLSAGLIDWLCMAVVLLIFGKIVSKTSFRVIDIFGTQAMARWPTVITSTVVLLKAYERFNQYLMWRFANMGEDAPFQITDGVIFGAAVLVILAVICWMVALMYRSYSTSCNIKGGKAIGTFIGGLFIAEIISKIVIIFIVSNILGSGIGAYFEATSADDSEEVSVAIESAETWLGVIDNGKYAESWEESAIILRNHVGKEQWVSAMESHRKPFGKLISRKVKLKRYKTSLPGAPDGKYVVIQFKTSFVSKKRVIETVTPMLDEDGKWRVSGYYMK